MKQEEWEMMRSIQLEVMDEIHRLCEKHKIKYYIIGGTTLGSVRHEGFIPWDIDIDIAMPREDYTAFKSVCETECEPDFEYVDYMKVKNFIHPHALFCKKGTLAVNHFSKYNPHIKDDSIYVDIFPLDNAPESKSLQERQERAIKRILKIKNYKLAYCYDNNFLKKLSKKAISALFVGTTIKKINKRLENEIQKYNDRPTKYLCSMTSHYSYTKQCMDRDIYGKPQLMKFEGRMYYGPQDADTYLKKIYGDYMKLPPEEERKANLEIFEKIIVDG